jgi:GH43 family beta-xylosidase
MIIPMMPTALLAAFILSCQICLSQKTFTSPLLFPGADPWSIYKSGYYYYTHSFGDRLVIWKTKSIADLKTAPQKTVPTEKNVREKSIN